jgi:hypothetical protein
MQCRNGLEEAEVLLFLCTSRVLLSKIWSTLSWQVMHFFFLTPPPKLSIHKMQAINRRKLPELDEATIAEVNSDLGMPMDLLCCELGRVCVVCDKYKP